ncbi:hypothetical protein GOODEAATRI_025980, partial [Goodea atripinnis]
LPLCFPLPVTSLAPSTTLSHTAVSKSLVMSPGGVASDGSVTLTLTDTQGMLDGVTLNLSAQLANTFHFCSYRDLVDGALAHRMVSITPTRSPSAFIFSHSACPGPGDTTLWARRLFRCRRLCSTAAANKDSGIFLSIVGQLQVLRHCPIFIPISFQNQMP